MSLGASSPGPGSRSIKHTAKSVDKTLTVGTANDATFTRYAAENDDEVTLRTYVVAGGFERQDVTIIGRSGKTGDMRFEVRRVNSLPGGEVGLQEECQAPPLVKSDSPDEKDGGIGGSTPTSSSLAISDSGLSFKAYPSTEDLKRSLDSGLDRGRPETKPLMDAESPPPVPAARGMSSAERQHMNSVALLGRQIGEQKSVPRKRLFGKGGECNISVTKVKSKNRRYLADIFTTMVEARWRINLTCFAVLFVGSWTFFAVLWWAILRVRGDHLHYTEDDWVSCANNVYDFPTALLFSIETQTTIGYGFRAMEPKCPEAIVLVMVQSLFGVFFQSLMVGMIFAKLSRPKRRSETVVFSKNAVICQRDNELVLLFRVGDMRKAHLINTNLRAIMVQNRTTKESELIPLCQYPLDMETESSNKSAFAFLVWPITVMHRINSSSPLWTWTAQELIMRNFEVVIIMEATIETSGMTTQVRTSYLPSEILWGHRLSPLLTYMKENGQYKIDYTQFHATIPVNTPTRSAESLSKGDFHGEYDAGYHPNFTLPTNLQARSPPRGVVKRIRSFSKTTKKEYSSPSSSGGGTGEPEVKPLRSPTTGLVFRYPPTDVHPTLSRRHSSPGLDVMASGGGPPASPIPIWGHNPSTTIESVKEEPGY